MRAVDLRVQDLKEPIGISTERPMFSYVLKADENNRIQSAWQILAASRLDILAKDSGDLWDSGRQEGNHCFGIRYAGKELLSRQRIYWKVRVWDQDGVCGDWSDPSFWEMGLLKSSDWKGCWIGRGEESVNQSDAPILACDFELEDLGSIASTRAYISGLGIFYAYLNGEALSDTFFEPGESDVTKSVYYVTYDLKDFLRKGKNSFEIVLGNGQYTGYTINPVMVLEDGTKAPEGRYQKNDSCYVKQGLCGQKKALVQIEAQMTDGTGRLLAASGTDWRIAKSPVVFQNWYGGEDYDGVLEMQNSASDALEEIFPEYAKRMKAPAGRLMARECPPIRIYERVQAVSVSLLPNGNYLVDMGTNGAGVPELYLTQTDETLSGTWVHLYPAEILKEDGSCVDQRSCTQSWSELYDCVIRDSYRIAGIGTEQWHPKFCYHGFRYLEVEGFPGKPNTSNFVCLRLRADAPYKSSFRTSDETLNQINEITERSIASNMFWSFTDCPQIEKLGWIETSHLMFNSVASVYDIRAWMKKILRDINDAQLMEKDAGEDGMETAGFVPGIIPEYYRIHGLYRDPNWNGACVQTPWEYYQYYGDISVLEAAFPVMERYIAYLQHHLKNGVLEEYAQMGDWGEFGEHTPTVLVATCAYYRMLSIVAQTAQLFGMTEKQQYYEMLKLRTKEAFYNHPECYDRKRGLYGTGSQASFGCVLFCGLVDACQTEKVVTQLVDAVERNGFHLTSGEVGLRQVFASLAKNGRSDVVYKMVMNKTAPSYRFFVDHGLTTLPEYWNYDELWFGMVRSRNHAMMGHVREWLIYYLLGVSPVKPGWEEVKIKPYIPERMNWAEGSVFTPWGDIRMRWERIESQVRINAEIPAGVTAQIIRNGEKKQICSGKYQWTL